MKMQRIHFSTKKADLCIKISQKLNYHIRMFYSKNSNLYKINRHDKVSNLCDLLNQLTINERANKVFYTILLNIS